MRDDAAAWVFLVLLGLIVLLWMVAVLVPKLTYRRNIKGSGEVYLGSSGIHLNGSVHTWRLLGSRFESAQYRADPFPLLAVLYSYLMVAGRSLYFFRQYFAVSVPVPAGKEDDAKNIAKILPARQGKAGKPSGRAGKGGRPSHIPL
jgi:hypothetical protein